MKQIFLCLTLAALLTPAGLPGQSVLAAVTNSGNATLTTQDAAQRQMDWNITGPMGGDVRSLIVDPRDAERLYLGTIDGQMYTSADGARHWSRVQSFSHPGLYIDNIIIDARDSNTLYIGAHRHTEPGGFFKTTDGGQTWRESTELKGEAIHSLAQSASDPSVLVAGSNRGVYRSNDGGETWVKLPTEAYADIRNVESLAIDPRDPAAIYVGTWHLPWKTEDGGQTWRSIKNGIIDDSDVFAIEIDARKPDHVIASACSGIYESKNAGASFRKVQGIPSQSRRTRDIMQHPSQPNTIYAGTTEGFWRSLNGGDSWMLTTSRQLEINAIAVHPNNPLTVYLGTNNYGVMISRDGGKTFLPSNDGYSGRRAYALTPDRERPGRVYASTINTATGGGFFFVSNDGGQTWQPSMRNLPNRLIAYSILQDRADANIIYLGTNLGLYRSLDRGASWSPIGAPDAASPPLAKGKRRGGRTAPITTAGRRRAKAMATQTARNDSTPSTSRSGAAPDDSARTNPPISTRPRRASQPTQNSESTTSPPVRVKARSVDETTKQAQAALNAAGYNVGTPDGVAGTRTVTALRKFQADKSVPQSGKFDDATLTALGLGGGKQTGDSAEATQTATVALTETINALANLVQADGQTLILAATNNGVYRSLDPARGWTKMPFGGTLDARSLCISTSSQNPQTIWVGTATSGVVVSRDGGQTWQEVAGVPKEAPVNVIEQDAQRSAYVYVGTTQTLYVSHDGGEKWMRRGGNLPYGSYTSILIDPNNGDELFVGSAYERAEGSGVFHSTDAGVTWKRVDPDLPSRRVWALAFDSRDPGKLLVGSHSAGVYVARRDTGADAGAVSGK